ncbi:MAG: hypothetical protein ACO3C1_00785 [Ilumatobacteraceae bacterium]
MTPGRSMWCTVTVSAVVVAAVVLSLPSPSPANAEVPANCVEHVPLDGSVDVPGDHRCAGLALDYFVGGAERSPSPTWAGQWLFTDEDGVYRTGWCVYHLGQHPLSGELSHTVDQRFANDLDGREVAYLTWRYRDAVDPLTVAALWAVFHYYAGDAAGPLRSDSPDAPLVPTLDGVGVSTGREDVGRRAIELVDEARRVAGDTVPEWHLDLTVADAPTPAGRAVTVTLVAGEVPIAGQPISVLVSGSDLPLAATTGPDGTATVAVPLLPGTATVVATTDTPGPAVVYRGTPAQPSPQGAQLLVTAGTPVPLTVSAVVDVPATTVTEVPSVTVDGADAAAPGGERTLPVAGGSADPRIAAVGLAALVAGVGLVGTVRRPRRPGPLGPPTTRR